ncbi:MAG: ketoacyl-ACP synthase III [Pseudanabaena sp. M090S1SP1A06QC]|jgi:3-oxoacyl-[acyl-carrier-protein] synthase-3|nr:ketoacyl-ACP synthase III [Pseudanabaena sp. M53BS1SP1A06MG]MCA6581235.1 ketoacyl-ACP synthase III [Pseudanabaena sp. M34BS1SP1A06MG]MCA6585120.1 ketoacyl-ACP synthase III [Pseudanabaena sp. M051S1SP1A06QC]MCA6589023.1 ketoacyl-ACP synthase III [Pseudanabaena sp. M109S1SP1A06QC]MCA6592784.1 ketoacyl-ACP synthase III [Pseudanabaena sp. M38BS1SP1A06MG]MCA6601522.1 ketoacyl-ACP synthase III [Pseudanabaena sp. M57BS1SP1A06MG]MCA6604090.1 ketoacyl-ACP synthase III [Pseudanabaena sp. M007S1SP1A0
MTNTESSLLGVRFIGSGSAVPDRVLTNQDLAQMVDTNDEWISSRTGIRERHIADGENDSVANLAAKAAQQAITAAGLQPENIDLIILSTSTSDDLFGTAGRVQKILGAERAVAFDLVAACSGFVFGLVTASQYIRTGVYQNVLLIGADVLSRWVDWQDRRTCILFGDGAGAVVLQSSSQNRLLGFEMRSDGKGNDLLNINYLGRSTFHPITMNGQEVYRFAVRRVPEVIEKSLHHAGLAVNDLDWLIMHQANQRIIDAVVNRFGIDPAKAVSNMGKYGNTSAASIPIALNEWVKADKIQKDNLIAIAGFGAGLSWGSAVFRWG